MTAQQQQIEFYKHRIEALERRVAILELNLFRNDKIKNRVASAGNGRQRTSKYLERNE